MKAPNPAARRISEPASPIADTERANHSVTSVSNTGGDQYPDSTKPHRSSSRLYLGVESEQPDTRDVAVVESKRMVSWFGVLATLGVLMAAWLTQSLASYAWSLWRDAALLALPVTLLVAVFLVICAVLLGQELFAMKRITQVKQVTRNLQNAYQQHDIQAMKHLLKPGLHRIAARHPEQIKSFTAAARDIDNVTDYQALLTNTLLLQLDQQADAAIKAAALQSALAVAIVPHPALDALVVLWRANRLMRQIGEIYGLAPTHIAAQFMMKDVVVSMILAAGLDLAGDVVLEELSHGVIENAGKLLAEGSVTAYRMARLGRVAKRYCRSQWANDTGCRMIGD